MTDDAFQTAGDNYDPTSREPAIDHDAPRSLSRISPSNEAENCETVAEAREKLQAELDRDEPRKWIIALFNERIAELENDE